MKLSKILMVLWVLLTSITAVSLPRLSSYPSADATIYLDFDGQNVVNAAWNGGSPIVCAPANLTDAQITQVFNRVAEDYRPFNINITTDEAIFIAAPLTKRIRIIVTPTSSWYTGVGGVAYTRSFTWGDDTPAFVFPDRLGNNPKMIAECCTHESGHTVGLSHQSLYNNSCALVATYNAGVGTGEISWAPVMGNSYYKNVTSWNNGPTPSGCNAAQDNLSIITTQNGFTYRIDDFSDEPNNNPGLITFSNQTFSNPGIITTPSDRDAFRIVLSSKGALHVDAVPYSVGASSDGANLDIKLTLYNSTYQTIGTYDASSALSAIIDTTLDAGTYYVSLQGTGNINTPEYGSLGSYTISGSFSPSGVLPIREVALSGKADKNSHTLSWNIIADEPIKTIVIESSTDGRNFTRLTTLDGKEKNFSYATGVSAEIFYRLKVTSVINQTVHSNVIVLKGGGGQVQQKLFKLSTLVRNEIVINAPEDYQYILSDMYGRIVGKGKHNSGMNWINVSNIANGMYVVQIISNTNINNKQTERIVKQ